MPWICVDATEPFTGMFFCLSPICGPGIKLHLSGLVGSVFLHYVISLTFLWQIFQIYSDSLRNINFIKTVYEYSCMELQHICYCCWFGMSSPWILVCVVSKGTIQSSKGKRQSRVLTWYDAYKSINNWHDTITLRV